MNWHILPEIVRTSQGVQWDRRKGWSELQKCLKREVWVFTVNFPNIVLDEYRIEARPTNRHKWRVTKIYNRLSPRTSLPSLRMQGQDVPMPDTVKAEAIQAAAESLTFLGWMWR